MLLVAIADLGIHLSACKRRTDRERRRSDTRSDTPPQPAAARRRRSSLERRRTKRCRSIANANARRKRSPSSSGCRSNSTKRCTCATGAREAFDAAQEIANDGDALFTQHEVRRCDGAITKRASRRSKPCSTQGDARFNDALDNALQAIDQRDAAAAEAAYVDRRNGVSERCAYRRRTQPRATPAADHRTVCRRRSRQESAATWRTMLAKYPCDSGARSKDARTARPARRRAVARCEPRLSGHALCGVCSTRIAADYDAAKRAFEAALRQRPNDGRGTRRNEPGRTTFDVEQHRAVSPEGDARRSRRTLGRRGSELSEGARGRCVDQVRDGRSRPRRRTRRSRPKVECGDRRSRCCCHRTRRSPTTTRCIRAPMKIADPGPRLTDQVNRLGDALAIARDPVCRDADLRLGNGSDDFATRRTRQIRPQRGAIASRPVRTASAAATANATCAANSMVVPQMAPVEISLSGSDLTVSADEPLIRPATLHADARRSARPVVVRRTPRAADLHDGAAGSRLVRLVHLHGEVGTADVRSAECEHVDQRRLRS